MAVDLDYGLKISLKTSLKTSLNNRQGPWIGVTPRLLTFALKNWEPVGKVQVQRKKVDSNKKIIGKKKGGGEKSPNQIRLFFSLFIFCCYILEQNSRKTWLCPSLDPESKDTTAQPGQLQNQTKAGPKNKPEPREKPENKQRKPKTSSSNLSAAFPRISAEMDQGQNPGNVRQGSGHLFQ